MIPDLPLRMFCAVTRMARSTETEPGFLIGSHGFARKRTGGICQAKFTLLCFQNNVSEDLLLEYGCRSRSAMASFEGKTNNRTHQTKTELGDHSSLSLCP